VPLDMMGSLAYSSAVLDCKSFFMLAMVHFSFIIKLINYNSLKEAAHA
jgi:hypothetical protein